MNGEDLKIWRQGARVPYERIAEATGVGRETVRNWERGLANIPLDAVETIRAMMSGRVVRRKKPDLSGGTELELLEELAYRARQREYRLQAGRPDARSAAREAVRKAPRLPEALDWTPPRA